MDLLQWAPVRISLAVPLAVLLLARLAAADTEVRRAGDRVSVRATASALSEVLDRLGRETGMKVTYDGAPPRARVTVVLTGVTALEAVYSVLEGQGLNYALRLDPTATRVETLLIVAGGGTTATGGGSAMTGLAPPRQGPRMMEREPPENPEPEEDTPAETPARDGNEERKMPFVPGSQPGPGVPPGSAMPMGPTSPSGPAVPLAVPTPPMPGPAGSAAPVPSPAPQD